GAGLFLPASAYAQTNRLEIWENRSGDLYRKWSDDGGSTWSASVNVGIWGEFQQCSFLRNYPRSNFLVIGNPAIVSDQPGRLWVVVKTFNGLLYNRYDQNGGQLGWCPMPGAVIQGTTFDVSRVLTDTWHDFNADSSPALASWGPGRLELFIYATDQ